MITVRTVAGALSFQSRSTAVEAMKTLCAIRAREETARSVVLALPGPMHAKRGG